MCSVASKALISPRNRSIFWKTKRKEKAGKLNTQSMWNKSEDIRIENLNSMESLKIAFNESDIYAEVFDSLIIETPPPLPSRKSPSRVPARPPYPSSFLKL